MPLIITAATPVVKSGAARQAPVEVGGWLTTVNRDRKGRPIGTTVEVLGKRVPTDTGLSRWLSTSEMWTIYRRCPEVRASIDSIVRRVATWDWFVEVQDDPDSEDYQFLQEKADNIRRFLAAPNTDGETWQELITKFLTDLLVFDQGALELVKTPTKELIELICLRGSSIEVVRDDRGRLLEYIQDYSVDDGSFGSADAVHFLPEELLFMRLYPTTAGPEGNSLLESVIDEVVTLLNSSKHLMLAFDADEIPPGILVLAGLAGKAADKAAQDLREMRGQDQKIRVITTPDPTSVGANWVELRRTPKDLEMREVIREVRRCVWRVFGVLPVEMGATDGIPRATAEVQLEVASSHLVNPILELIESKINARILPLLVGDEDLVARFKFRFDREAKLSQEEQNKQAATLATLVKSGIITRNEARETLGRRPQVEGDILTVEATVLPLEKHLENMGAPSDDPFDPENPDDPTGPGGPSGNEGDDPFEGTDPAPGEADADEEQGVEDDSEAPGEIELSLRSPTCRLNDESFQDCIARKLPEIMEENPKMSEDEAVNIAANMCETFCTIENVPKAKSLEEMMERARLMPSEWQPNGRFRKVRTLDLPKLADSIMEYTRLVEPIWRETQQEVVSAIAAAYDLDRGGFTEESAEKARSTVNDAMDKLVVKWRAATGHLYIDAARIARDKAVDWTGTTRAAENWESEAEQYFELAMAWLTAPDGPIERVRFKINDLVRVQNRSKGGRTIPELRELPTGDLTPEETAILDALVAEESLLASAEVAFNGQAYRMFNWSGKLNYLSNEVLYNGLRAVEEAEGTEGTVEWAAEWVSVGDNRTCETCDRESIQGLRALSEMPLRPGGDTECRGNCRCVLVFWTRDEIKNGQAEIFGPTGT